MQNPKTRAWPIDQVINKERETRVLLDAIQIFI